MDRIPLLAFSADAFVFLNWLLTIASAIWLAVIFRRSRFLFIKPSILVVFWSHFFFQWPASIYATYYERVLPDPYAFVLLLHGFVLAGLLISSYTFNQSAREVFHRLNVPQPVSVLFPTLMLATFCAAVTAVYLQVVPLQSTGLYIILTHPALAAVAREDSLKLITNAPLQYAYQIMAGAAAPLLAVNIALLGSRAVRSRRIIYGLVLFLIFVALLIVASLSGNRSTAAKLLLVVALSAFLLRGLPFRPLHFLFVLIAILTPAVLITLLREGKTFTGSIFFAYLTDAIFTRVFVGPINVGAFYVHYAQTHGPIGPAGIARLASLVGVTPVRMPNIIGNLYSYSGLESVSANSGFLFTYYGYFGILSLPISLIGLWLLDLALPIYLRLEPRLLLPAVAAASVASLSFISSEYTTVLLTHGFAVILLLSIALSWYLRSGEAPSHFSLQLKSLGSLVSS